MEKETYNKSLSARIKRRNKQGFIGNGTGFGFKRTNFGDYNDPAQNYKNIDYDIAERRKNKVGMKSIIGYNGIFYTSNKRALNKRYADNHQKL